MNDFRGDRIKVIDLSTGKRGSIDVKDFDPSRFKPDYNWIQKLATSNVLPMITAIPGGIAGGMVGGIAGGVGAVPGAVGGSSLTAAGTKFLQDQVRPYVGLPEKDAMAQAQNFGEGLSQGAEQEVLGQGIMAAGSKILGPVLGKIKGWTPKGMSEGADVLKGKAGKEISKILKEVDTRTVDLKALLKKIASVQEQPQVKVNPKSIKIIDDLMENIMSIDNVGDAYGSKVSFGQDIFGEAGKELTKRGSTGIATKQATKIAGQGLEDILGKAAPELTGPMAEYGAVSKVANELSNPFKYHLGSGLVSALPTMAGAPALTPAAMAAGSMLMPYPRMLMQKAIGGLLSSPITQTGAKLGYSGLMDFLKNNNKYNEYLPKTQTNYRQ